MRSIREYLDHLDSMVEKGRHTTSIRIQIDFVTQLVARLEKDHATLEAKHAHANADHAIAIADRDAKIFELEQQCAKLQQAIKDANWTELERFAAAHSASEWLNRNSWEW